MSLLGTTTPQGFWNYCAKNQDFTLKFPKFIEK